MEVCHVIIIGFMVKKTYSRKYGHEITILINAWLRRIFGSNYNVCK